MRTLSLLLAAGAILSAVPANAENVEWQKIDAAFGRTAVVTADVHRYGFPRSDLSVTLDGVTIKPALALGGWSHSSPHMTAQW